MVSIDISPHVSLSLNDQVFSEAYLNWVDQMIASPSKCLYYQAPAHGSTVWMDGQWCLYSSVQEHVDSDGVYHDHPTVIRAPLQGELAVQFRELVAANLSCEPHYYLSHRLSEVTDSRAHLHSDILCGDQTLEAVWLHNTAKILGHQPLAEVVCHYAADISRYMYAWPTIHATRIIISDGNHCTLVAPVVILLDGDQGTIAAEIRCLHLILGQSWLLRQLEGRVSCERLSVMEDDWSSSTEYQKEGERWVETETPVDLSAGPAGQMVVTHGQTALDNAEELMAPVVWDDQHTFRLWDYTYVADD